MSTHYIYILETKNGSYYTGYTTDLERRLTEHKSKSPKGAKFTRAFGVKKLLYHEKFATRADALKREGEIKKLSRTSKESLIQRKK